MELPLAIFLGLYVILVIVFLILSGVNAYHIVRFGEIDRRNQVMLIIYTILTAAILVSTAIYFAPVAWDEAVSLTPPSLQAPLPGL